MKHSQFTSRNPSAPPGETAWERVDAVRQQALEAQLLPELIPGQTFANREAVLAFLRRP